MVNWKKLVKRIPARVQVKPKLYYEVVWCDEFPRDHEQVGETNHNNKQIIIKRGLSPKLTVTIFLHECAHTFSDEYEMGLTENQILASEKFYYYILKPGNVFKED